MAGRSKFNVNTSKKAKEKRTLNGHTFDSDIEYKFYVYILSQQEEELIKEIIIQPKFELQQKYEKLGKKVRPIQYIADFQIEYTNGEIVVFDVKGMVTPEFKLKRKIFDYIFPDKVLRCVNYSRLDNGWCDIEDIEKGRKLRKKEKLGKV